MRTKIGGLLVVLLIALMPCEALSEQSSLLYYILDGSGSMWGRVEGKMKIQIAKDVMSTLIREIPENIHGGLMVYGHRRRGDCADIEELLPIGVLDKKEALRCIRSISPKGMTPISDSIEAAVGKLRSKEYAATIVLVSDGLETCEKDPCRVTKKLKESGVDFVMHVVGFGVKDEADQELSCIAHAGGGKYFTASNAEELLGALNTIKQSVVEKKEVSTAVPTPNPTAKPTPTPSPTPVLQEVKSSSTSIRIKAKGPGRITFIHDSWLTEPEGWFLLSPESGVEKGRFQGLGTHAVSPGEYQLAWKQSEHGSSRVVLGEVFSVVSGTSVEVPLRTGIELVLPQWVKEPRRWWLHDPLSGEEVVWFVPLEPQLVPAGQYELFWQQSEHGAAVVKLADVELEPDKLNRVEMLTGFNPAPAEWLKDPPLTWGLRDPEGKEKDIWFADELVPELVPAGTYEVFYRRAEHDSSDALLGQVVIKEGELVNFPINTGVKLIFPAGSEEPYQVWFTEIDKDGKELQEVWLKQGAYQPMPLRAGTYRVKVHQSEHGSEPMTVVDSFELPRGALVEIEM